MIEPGSVVYVRARVREMPALAGTAVGMFAPASTVSVMPIDAKGAPAMPEAITVNPSAIVTPQQITDAMNRNKNQ